MTRVRAPAPTVRVTGITDSAGKRGDASGRAFYEAPGAVGGEGLRTWRERAWATWLETWEWRANGGGGTDEMLVEIGDVGSPWGHGGAFAGAGAVGGLGLLQVQAGAWGG